MVEIGISMINVGEYFRSFYIDSEKDNIVATDVVNSLSDFKRLTRASVINISEIILEDKSFKIVHPHSCNDGMHISVINSEGKTVFRGSIIIMGFYEVNGRDTLRDLTDEEVHTILDNIGLMYITGKEGKESYNAYVLCNAKLVDRR